jgi:hypothetical protein
MVIFKACKIKIVAINGHGFHQVEILGPPKKN